MKTETFELPNGFLDSNGTAYRKVELRSMNGSDENFLRDKKELKKENVILRLLQRAIVRVGEVEGTKAKELVYHHMPIGDMLFLLVNFRVLSMGPTYRFTKRCPECNHTQGHGLDLTTLPVNKQDPKFCGKMSFDAEVEELDGTKLNFKFRPLLAQDQHSFAMVADMYPAEKATRQMLLQVEAINGEEPIAEQVAEMSSYTLGLMREEMDKVVGGIDLSVVSTCSKCDAESKAQMSVELASFFSRTVLSSNEKMARPSRGSGTPVVSSGGSGTGKEKAFLSATATS